MAKRKNLLKIGKVRVYKKGGIRISSPSSDFKCLIVEPLTPTLSPLTWGEGNI